MDPILQAMLAHEFHYPNQDMGSVVVLEDRINSYARRRQLITYSQLVQGVTFHFASIRNGAPYRIDVEDWTNLDRQIVGEFLGFISMRSYQDHQFMLSALVVNKAESKPSEPFFEWMKSLNALPNLNEQTVFAFWGQQVNLAHQYYTSH